MHIHFSGIGGMGIGPLAQLSQDCGYSVSGSDLKASQDTRNLEKRGIRVSVPQTSRQIAEEHAREPIDWLIISSALPAKHPEIEFAHANNIRISKRDELLNHILEDKNLKLLAVAGTHGKSTTTGIAIWCCGQLGQPISYSIGANLFNGPSARYQSGSQVFVYEADEFDRNFLQFHPDLSIITTVDFDHADTYPNPESYQSAFRDFVNQSTQTFIWTDDSRQIQLKPSAGRHIIAASADTSAIRLPGHNQRNGYLVLQALKVFLPHASEAKLVQAINSFPGIARRMEKLADNLYSDYAHHPTEIRSTLELANLLNKNIVVVYQPHQNVRQNLIQNQYQDCFGLAQKVYWLPTFLSREYQSLDVLPPQQLIAKLADPHIAEPAKMDRNLIQKINKHRQNGDLVILMGAGSIDEWARRHLVGDAAVPTVS